MGLYKLFLNVDYDDDGIITNKEFSKILKDFKMELTEEDSMYIFAQFDREKTGVISYEKFITNVLGSFTREKKDIVDSVWKKLDPHKAGKIPIGDVKAMLKDLRNHPDVKSGRKSEDQIVSEYWDLLDFQHSVIENSKSQYILQREFESFLLYISAVVEDERYFEMIVQTTFKMVSEKNYEDTYAGAGRKDYNPKLGYLNDFHRSKFQGGSVAANAPFGTQQNMPKISEEQRPRTSQYNYNLSETSGYQNISRDKESYSDVGNDRLSEKEILEELRQKILGRGIRGILILINLLRRKDEDRLRSLPISVFIRILKDFRIDLSEDDLRNVLSYLNLNKNGRVDYDIFLDLIKGDLSKQRRGLIVGTYERISKEKRGYVTIEDLKDLFNAKQHPDARSGRKPADDILMEFLETFEIFHDIFTISAKGRDNRVSMEEFVAYYDNISSLVEDERRFEQIITDCWRKSYKNSWDEDNNDQYKPQEYRKSYSRNY